MATTVSQMQTIELVETEGMFGIGVLSFEDNRLKVYAIVGNGAPQAAEEIDAQYPYDSIELTDVEMKIQLNNDLRESVSFLIDGSMVDNIPVDEETPIPLKRRGMVQIVPSDVRRKSSLLDGYAKFATLVISAKDISSPDTS